MPFVLNLPVPRSYTIGAVNGQPVDATREWLKYWTQDIPTILGGTGELKTLPEIAAEVTESGITAGFALTLAQNAGAAAVAAQESADDAQAAADAAQADIDALEADLLAVYETRLDVVAGSPEVFYVGQAVPGSLDAAAVWRIAKYTVQTDGDLTSEYADGDANFDNVWDDRLTLVY